MDFKRGMLRSYVVLVVSREMGRTPLHYRNPPLHQYSEGLYVVLTDWASGR